MVAPSLFQGPSVEQDHLPSTCKEISEEQVFLNTHTRLCARVHTHMHLLFIDPHMKMQKEPLGVVAWLVCVQSTESGRSSSPASGPESQHEINLIDHQISTEALLSVWPDS